MSAKKRLVEYHCARLKDKSPDVRLKSIRELELLCDTDALDALQQLFQSDDNYEVRRAAQIAGRSIFLKNNSEQQR